MPRTETVTHTYYKYEELDEAAQKKAREAWANDAHEYFEPSHLSEWFRDELERACLPTDDLEWSLSYSQGDGVAFYGTIDDLTGLLRKARKLSRFRGLRDANGEWRVDVSLSRNSSGYHYSHWNTMQVNVEWTGAAATDPTAKQDALMDELHDVVKAYVQAQSRQMEKDGYADIEYQTSEDRAPESFEANEDEFYKDGTRA